MSHQIHHAIEKKDLPKVRSILQLDPSQATVKSPVGDTPLHVAVMVGSVEIVQLLLDYGVDPNVQGADGDTPLHIAARIGYTDLTDILIKKGTNINVCNDFGQTPLMVAVLGMELECGDVANLLVDRGVQVDLASAILLGKTAIVKTILEKDKDAVKDAPMIGSFLTWSIGRGYYEITRLLLENGFDPNVTDYRLNIIVAVEQAISSENLDILRMVIEKGANVNTSDFDGRTVIEFARSFAAQWHGQRDLTLQGVINLLKQYGAKE